MVNYIKTTNGYFYKICKNGKKRISEDEYNKQRKIKKMTGGVQLETIKIDEPRSRNEVMENVFLTGDILANGKTSTISKINKKFMDFLTHVKTNYVRTNNKIIGKQRRIESNLDIDITYVGEIRYNASDRSHAKGISNIWVQQNYKSKKVRYIVEIKRNDDTSYDFHVKNALQALCNIDDFNLLIQALSRIGIQSDDIHKLIHEISNIDNHLMELNQKKHKLEQEKNLAKENLQSKINIIDWTFTPHSDNNK
jgi:hypothetical protein